MRLGAAFQRLWFGNAFGNLADGLAFVTIPLVAVALTSSPALIAGLATAYSLTRLLVTVPIGVYVDRLDRRTLMWTANLLRGLALVALAGLLFVGQPSIWVLYAVYCFVGIMENVADNAAVAILPDLVAEDQLDSANSHISSVQLIADEFAGPPLGGLLFGIAAGLAVITTGSLYCLAALAFLLLPRKGPGPDVDLEEPRPGLWAEAVEGLRWMAGHAQIRTLAGIGALANFAYMVPFSILVLFALERLHLSAAGYGVLLAVSSLGGLVGAAVAASVRRRLGYRFTMALSMVLGSATLLGLGFTTNPVVAGLLLALYILHATVYSIAATSLRQRLVPAHLRGRTYAGSRVLSLTGLALGGAVGGVLAETLSLAAPLFAGGIAFAVAAVWATSLKVDGPAPPEA
ncbi:MFS transporter [Ornithinimicrobium faecis]|uniref:MFS transporter n=1 Tax=Ornithinimicrobium faecis TaxID=2934158 RepID=A0ABY4YTB4_9MICO|nr:MFS transporter [Ornithinimicrobium sp. HY1793]USQ80021.1 MFS transporter [Ornithinimicrobium sp. HY1793]